MRKTMIKGYVSLSALLGIAALVGCGGGGGGSAPPPPAAVSTLVYTAPTSVGAAEFQWVKNATKSTASHLVLDLIGPTGVSGRGVGFYLSADANKVTWSKVDPTDAELVRNEAFTLGSGSLLLKAKFAGDQLQAGVYQKDPAAAAKPFGASTVLVSVALDMKPGAATGPVTLSTVPNKSLLLPATGDPTAAVIRMGALEIKTQ